MPKNIFGFVVFFSLEQKFFESNAHSHIEREREKESERAKHISSPMAADLAQADLTRKSCIHRNRNHQPIWHFMCTHTQSYYIMCKYKANADLLKSVFVRTFVRSFGCSLLLDRIFVRTRFAVFFAFLFLRFGRFFHLVIRLFYPSRNKLGTNFTMYLSESVKISLLNIC